MKPYYEHAGIVIYAGDCLDVLRSLPDGAARCCITSPPYWGLRDYGHDGQIGLEPTPEEYVSRMVEVFREVRRVLTDDGTLWLNLGDSYAANTTGGIAPQGGTSARPKIDSTEYAARRVPNGLKPKDLVGIPWRVAFALQADGWYLRQDIIWAKPNPMPESVTDRCTKAHEYLFLLAKSERYYYDQEALKEPVSASSIERWGTDKPKRKNPSPQGLSAGSVSGESCFGSQDGTRNRRSVWTISTKPFNGAHFAVMPEDLVKPCILAGTARGDVVIDPFTGAGTTAKCAKELGRGFVGSELNPAYCEIAAKRMAQEVLL